ncbi:MAG: DUF3048 domain-containing protein [Anaerolineae bacterium]|nr:DUF3048 domain-containing protein [Anaerolineae bacterium]
MTRFRPITVRWLILAPILLSLLLSGCGSGGRATPTPTKTPRPALAVATATPLPPTPTTMATPTPPPTATPTPPPTAMPTPVPPTPTPELYARAENENPLTGLPVDDPAKLRRRPLFVVINNDPPARSVHYGFGEAELVYEYIMEGRAVTRFTAVFLAGESERIGPVRSARLINYYLTPQYSGALVASGAGQDVRWWLKHKMAAPYLDIDLDDPGNNVYSFSLGTDYRTRMQTSTARLRRWLANWDVEMDPQLPGFVFSQAVPSGAPGQSVTIPFPAQVTWTYDAASGRYLRAMGGVPHLDAATGQQLSAANVIIQTMPHEPTNYVEDSLGTTSIRIISVGEGAVTILRDGVSIRGTWQAGDTTMPQFFDAAGAPIALKPGNSWIEVVEPTLAVTVQ